MFPIVGTALVAVAMLLLSRLEVGTSVWVAAGFAVVLGLGLGMVMQVLVLAVQNAVDRSVMGVATSGSTMFRQVGGSIGVSLFGAIFASRLHAQLAARLPAGVHLPKTTNPQTIKLDQSVKNDLPFGFVQGQRYISLAALRKAKRTSELVDKVE